MKSSVTKILKIATVASAMISSSAMATILTGGLNVDNLFQAYISTDDSVAGTLIGSGSSWPTTYSLASTNLTVGQDYYLHVYAWDVGGPAGFLGDFDLAGSDHTFSNDSSHLTTNVTDWAVSKTGWSGYGAVTGYGLNGVGPWGYRGGVEAGAEWIWSANNQADNNNWFSTKISSTAVSEPGTLALLGLGLAGLGFARRRTQA